MRCNLFAKYIISAFIIGAIFLHSNTAHAFTISPAKVLVTIDAGESARVTVTITNTETAAGIFDLSAVGISQDSAGRPVLGTTQDEAAQWVKPENSAVALERGEKKPASFVITVPSGTSSGARHVGLVFNRRASTTSATTITGQLLTLVSVQVAGLVTERLTLASERTSAPLTTDNNWQFKLLVTNTGTIEVPLTGQVVVTDWQGRGVLVTPLTLGPELLPNTERVALVELPIQNKITRPGRYPLTFQIRYGQTNQEVTATQAIWFVPKHFLWIAAGVLLFILLLGAIIFKKKRN